MGSILLRIWRNDRWGYRVREMSLVVVVVVVGVPITAVSSTDSREEKRKKKGRDVNERVFRNWYCVFSLIAAVGVVEVERQVAAGGGGACFP